MRGPLIQANHAMPCHPTFLASPTLKFQNVHSVHKFFLSSFLYGRVVCGCLPSKSQVAHEAKRSRSPTSFHTHFSLLG